MTDAQSKLSEFLKKKKEAQLQAKADAPATVAAPKADKPKAPAATKATPTKPAPKADKPKAIPPPPSNIYIALEEIKFLPKLTAAQKEVMAQYKIRRDQAVNLKTKEARDGLGVLLKPKVLLVDQLFDFASKYGITDEEIKRWKKTPNEGTMRMALGNRLRNLISKSIIASKK